MAIDGKKSYTASTIENLKLLKKFFHYHQWCQKTYYKYDSFTQTPACCIVGGINVVANGASFPNSSDASFGKTDHAFNASYAMQNALEETLEFHPEFEGALLTLINWNDEIAKSRNDVIKLINETIVRLNNV